MLFSIIGKNCDYLLRKEKVQICLNAVSDYESGNKIRKKRSMINRFQRD